MRLSVAESPAGKVVDRIAAAVILGLAVVFVVLLAQVEPDPRGHATHEQLGMQPCTWPAVHGKPCPTCGVTTAATHLVHLHPIDAIVTQPFGAFLAAAGLAAAAIAAWSLARGESFIARIAGLPYGRLFGAAIALFLGSWAYTWFTWPAS